MTTKAKAKVCQWHGCELDPRVPCGGCWECDSERYEQERDRAEDMRVAEYKAHRDERW